MSVWMCAYICFYVYICMWMYVSLFVFFIVYTYKKKCGLKRIHKVVGHKMYAINILVCGLYGNF